jgi:type I restriction enzyme, S subunit
MSDLPDGWELVELQELAGPDPRSITDGPFGSNLKTAHYTENGPRVIRLQNIGYGYFIDERAHISESHFERLKNHDVQTDDLIIASLGEDLRACLIPDGVPPAVVKADCIRVRLHPDVDPRYVNFALQRPALRHHVKSQLHGVGRQRLGMEGIRRLSVPLAPAAEQRRIVAAIEEGRQAARHVAEQMSPALAKLGFDLMPRRDGGTLFQSVLASAFTGLLTSRPASDEPAAALVERIRNDRVARGPSRRARKASK